MSISFDGLCIVSGLPRSGTSMMMRMLQFGGMDIFQTQDRGKDISNPHGYFEHSSVKNIAHDNSFLDKIHSVAIKIVFPLIEFVPEKKLSHIIYMDRNPISIAASQAEMIKKLTGKEEDLARSIDSVNYLRELSEVFFHHQNTHNRLVLSYEDVVNSPNESSRRVVEFLNIELDVERMASAVELK